MLGSCLLLPIQQVCRMKTPLNTLSPNLCLFGAAGEPIALWDFVSSEAVMWKIWLSGT